jgi:signal transduction histidine kinase
MIAKSAGSPLPRATLGGAAFFFLIFGGTQSAGAQNAHLLSQSFLGQSLSALSVAITTGAVLIALLATGWALGLLTRLRQSESREDYERARLEAKLENAEAVLSVQPDATFIWEPLPGAPGVARQWSPLPRAIGSTANFVDPASGAPDYEYLLSRLDAASAARLRNAVERLRTHGARFAFAVQTRDRRVFESQGRPAGRQIVLWLRDMTGEREEVGRLASRLDAAEAMSATYRSFLNAAPFPAWLRGPDLSLVWVNTAYARAVEAGDPDQAVERNLELVGEEARAKAQLALQTGRVEQHKHYAVVAGERQALNIFDLPLNEGIAGVAIDITLLDEANSEMARHIAAHSETLDKLASAVAIFGPDKSLKFYNRAYTQLFGLDRDFLDSSPGDAQILDVLRETRRIPEQADFRAWKQSHLALYNSVETSEELWSLPDGQTLKVVCQPHPFGGLIYIYENLTENLKLASQYNTAIGVQRETLDNLHEGVAVFGSDGLLKLFNPAFARIWGLEPARLELGMHLADIASLCAGLAGDPQIWEDVKARVTALGDERRTASGRLERTDNSVIDYASVPLPDGATLLTYLDVSASTRIERALRERNEALETADRLKSEFISHVSYQLRTPLTNIIGFGEILETELFGPLSERQHEYTRGLLDASRQLVGFIDDLLDLASIEAGSMTLDLTDIDLKDVLQKTYTFVLQRAQQNKVHLSYDCPPQIGTIRADEARIRQIVYNLLSNALRFTSPGDRVAFGAERGAGVVRLWVQDTGTGMAPEYQASAFDRFESRGPQGQQRGAGLGLSLVRSLVELHGGWVTLESTEGEGTRVICHLPERARLTRPASSYGVPVLKPESQPQHLDAVPPLSLQMNAAGELIATRQPPRPANDIDAGLG